MKKVPPSKQSIVRKERKPLEFRSIHCEFDVVSEASASVYGQFGDTKIIVAMYVCENMLLLLYGPKQSATSTDKGEFECIFKYAKFSSAERYIDSKDSVKRSFGHQIEQAFGDVILLDKYPKSLIEAHVYVIQCDGNVVSHSINCVGLALMDAGIDMKDMVTSSQTIRFKTPPSENKEETDNSNSTQQNEFVDYLDPDLLEENNVNKECGITLAVMTHSQKITLLQMKGSLEISQSKHVFQLCIQSCLSLAEILKKQMFERFKEQNEQSKQISQIFNS
ncbi:hypothetical protein RFI_14808 [Reticulomyxa filosa]|uniref:Exoribonuclease phosphorolytic domain-containing protein n=1 Tax=Reticulomyxa filosa TaxID=46433 RepID=X6N9J0_RETFI|nr:hypothetical protein RFI_14808 [Reticulomyxa filosa]|eukprot:ETO22389.1 hypothetical protein RFI_14808 [Reticulomyxa filosa]